MFPTKKKYQSQKEFDLDTLCPPMAYRVKKIKTSSDSNLCPLPQVGGLLMKQYKNGFILNLVKQ